MRRSIILFLLLCVPRYAGAHGGMQFDPPRSDFSIGPAVGYANFGGEDGFALNFDASYTYLLFNASLNLKLARYHGVTLFVPQLEACAWFFMNIGGGAGWSLGDSQGPVLHVFFGLPLGDDWFRLGPFRSQFIEPYYRLQFFHAGSDWMLMHEVGVMFKLTTYTI